MINFNSFKKKDSQKNQNGNTQNSEKEDSIIEETVIEETQVEEGKKPTIAESATKNKLLIIPIFLVAIFLVYTLFIKDAFKAPPGQEKIEPVSDKGEVAPKIEKKEDKKEQVEPKIEVEVPPPPPPEKLELSPPPPIDLNSSFPIDTGSNTSPKTADRSVNEQELQNKISVNSLIVGGAGGASQVFGASGSATQGNEQTIGDSSAANVLVTKVKDPFNTIIQGKLIDVVLETAIYTELNGVLRAVVAQDVYAEKGKKILIPKGSRLIGSYNTDVAAGQTRIFIIWTRVIRPDGVDAQIGSPVTDLQGRAGLPGIVDNKYLELFSSSILSSLITIGIAAAAEGITSSGNVQTTETAGGSTLNSGGVKDYAVLDAVTGVTDLTKNVLKERLGVKKTITINQGERIKVFVNKDIIFPSNPYTSNTNIFR